MGRVVKKGVAMPITGPIPREKVHAERCVLIADRVRLTREGLSEMLTHRGVYVSALSADADSAGVALDDLAIDLVVCNAATVDLRGVVHAVRSVREIPVVAMSVTQTVAEVALCADLGLAGFILVEDSVEDLLSLIQTASIGGGTCPARAVPTLMKAVRARASTSESALTAREQEIAVLLQDGLANKEIAFRLGISTRTVKNHLHHVYDKLGLHSRGEVAASLHDQSIAHLTGSTRAT